MSVRELPGKVPMKPITGSNNSEKKMLPASSRTLWMMKGSVSLRVSLSMSSDIRHDDVAEPTTQIMPMTGESALALPMESRRPKQTLAAVKMIKANHSNHEKNLPSMQRLKIVTSGM